MALIKSISGIRGTIGGEADKNLTPFDIVKFTTAYGQWLKNNTPSSGLKVVVGRDARISGQMVKNIVNATLAALGIDVINLGLASTPTTEMAVPYYQASGGIIITASHNPKNWNALKLLNHQGEFLSDEEGKSVLNLTGQAAEFAPVEKLGQITNAFNFDETHIEKITKLPQVDKDAIKAAGFRVVFDGINSVGGIIGPKLLEILGVEVEKVNCRPTGDFAHPAEPLPENLQDTARMVSRGGYDLGFVVDPDVDRLAIINEDGTLFGEEYTLVAVADYILSMKPGNTVSNLSSSRALRDVTQTHGGTHQASAVGEVNVVEKMKATQAVIGGEGNGGVIFPDLHYGRDAMVGMALFLSHLARKKMRVSELRKSYPHYTIVKKRIELAPGVDVDQILKAIGNRYRDDEEAAINTEDGIKLDFDEGWVHLRKSNTEPIIRVIAEGVSQEKANALADAIHELASSLMK